jgi:hypothetical protein
MSTYRVYFHLSVECAGERFQAFSRPVLLSFVPEKGQKIFCCPCCDALTVEWVSYDLNDGTFFAAFDEDWRPSTVQKVVDHFTANGWNVGDVEAPWPGNPVPANVYADFLDERGESRAAALLREAFPLGPPEG